MRYGHETVKFWQIGYGLFHEKFLRFMSGIRNFGQVLDGTSEREFFLIRWNLCRTKWASENLITNTAAVVLLWNWVHLFYKRYVQKGPVNWLNSISSMGSSDISVWKREKIGYNIALSQAEVWSKVYNKIYLDFFNDLLLCYFFKS